MEMYENFNWYSLVKKALLTRERYLELKKWFSITSIENQEKFLALCREFIHLRPNQKRQMLKVSDQIHALMMYEDVLASESGGSLFKIHLNNVFKYTTSLSDFERGYLDGFMQVRYVANYSFLRVFYESNNFTNADAIGFTNLFGNHIDARKYIYHLDNLLHWLRDAQEGMNKARGTSIHKVLESSIHDVFKRMAYKTVQNDRVMYAKMIVAMSDFLDSRLWKFRIPRIADFDMGKSRNYILRPVRIGEDIHCIIFVLRICLFPLLNILRGDKLIDFSKHGDLKITQFGKLKNYEIWN